MVEERRYSLDELERRSGVPARQIRELIRLGILPGASSAGRGATYGNEHLDRLCAWKRLRGEAPPATTNERLRVLLERLQESGLLRGVAEGKIPFAIVDGERDGARAPRAPKAPASDGPLEEEPLIPPEGPVTRNEEALKYLRQLRAGSDTLARVAVEKTTLRGRLEVNLQAAPRSGAASALKRLHAALEDHGGAPSSTRAARADTWHRVSVGRDLEIAARGPLDDGDVHLLELVARLLHQTIDRRRTT